MWIKEMKRCVWEGDVCEWMRCVWIKEMNMDEEVVWGDLWV